MSQSFAVGRSTRRANCRFGTACLAASAGNVCIYDCAASANCVMRAVAVGDVAYRNVRCIIAVFPAANRAFCKLRAGCLTARTSLACIYGFAASASYAVRTVTVGYDAVSRVVYTVAFFNADNVGEVCRSRYASLRIRIGALVYTRLPADHIRKLRTLDVHVICGRAIEAACRSIILRPNAIGYLMVMYVYPFACNRAVARSALQINVAGCRCLHCKPNIAVTADIGSVEMSILTCKVLPRPGIFAYLAETFGSCFFRVSAFRLTAAREVVRIPNMIPNLFGILGNTRLEYAQNFRCINIYVRVGKIVGSLLIDNQS